MTSSLNIERTRYRRPRQRVGIGRFRGCARLGQRHGAPPAARACPNPRPKGHGPLWRPRRYVNPLCRHNLTATCLLTITGSHCERPTYTRVSESFLFPVPSYI